MKGEYQIPFDKDGNQLHYPEWNCEWHANTTFTAIMTYDGYSRGRSAAYAHLRDEYGKRYTAFMCELDKLIPVLDYGSTAGVWTFEKRGQNYGVKLVTAPNTKP